MSPHADERATGGTTLFTRCAAPVAVLKRGLIRRGLAAPGRESRPNRANDPTGLHMARRGAELVVRAQTA